jgi:hypothetical protein
MSDSVYAVNNHYLLQLPEVIGYMGSLSRIIVQPLKISIGKNVKYHGINNGISNYKDIQLQVIIILSSLKRTLFL